MNIPTKIDYEMHDAVVRQGMSIKETANAFARSQTTVRRAMDKVTEFGCEKFEVELTGDELKEVLGWLRNGNFTAKELANRIAADVEGS
jgi:transposase